MSDITLGRNLKCHRRSRESLYVCVQNRATSRHSLLFSYSALHPGRNSFFFSKVRDCCLSTLHAVGALLPVLLLELLVTLAYSCVCVVLYHGVSEAPFTTLSEAFLSLFALSTTVNDPDVWMPLYHRCCFVLVFLGRYYQSWEYVWEFRENLEMVSHIIWPLVT